MSRERFRKGRWERSWFLAVLGLLVLGCGGDAPERGLATTVDTIAGVVHVRHAGRAPEWRLEPVLGLGSAGGFADAPSPEEFGRIVRVIADAAGRVYVADALAHEIRVFDPDGGFVGSLGREGGGPGEIGGLHGMEWLAPDTLLVMDYGNARLAQLTTEGEQVGQWRWSRLTGRPLLFNGGEREAYAVVLVPAREEGQRIRTVWGRYRLGATADTLEIPTTESLGIDLATEYETCDAGDRGLSVFTNEFAPTLVRVPAPDLERAVALSGDYRVAFIGPGGDTTRVVTRDVAPAPLPDSAWARVQEEHAEWQNRWRGARCEGGISRPQNQRVIRDLYFDRGGRLVVEYNRPDGVAMDVFDRAGRWVGTVTPPDRDDRVPPYLHGDLLYTVVLDSLDVQRVRVDRLVPLQSMD